MNQWVTKFANRKPGDNKTWDYWDRFWSNMADPVWRVNYYKELQESVGTLIAIKPAARTIIGGTTYCVSSFFRQDAKNNVVDKVRRLITREISSN